jgi:hypothetical protein
MAADAAANVATWLLPFLALLTGAAEGVGEAIAQEGIEGARRAWSSLHAAAADRGASYDAALTDAAQRLTDHPNDDDALAAFRVAIREAWADQPNLAAELTEEAQQGISVGPVVAGSGSAVEAGDMYASPVVYGRDNKVSGSINIGVKPEIPDGD